MDNVIEFLKNKIHNWRKSNKKIDTAFKMLNVANVNGIEFEIIISDVNALSLFDDDIKNEMVILTTNIEISKKKHPSGYSYYEITGEEF